MLTRSNRIALSILSGVLLSLPWLGLPTFFIFFAFVPLLYLNQYFLANKARFLPNVFWGHSFLAFLIWNTASAWWMAKASVAGVAMGMLLSTSLMSAVFAAAHFISRKYSTRLGTIALLAFWISLEYLQFNWDMEWPCLQLGSILANYPKIIQWYEFTGTFGGTLWILMLNVFIYQFLANISKARKRVVILRNAFLFLVFAVVPVLVSYLIYSGYKEVENPIQIAIVQPNVDPYTEKFDQESEGKKLRTFLQLASGVVDNETDLLIGPETLFEHQWLWNEANFSANDYLDSISSFLGQFPKLESLFGVSSYTVYPDKKSARVTSQNKDGMYYDRFNTALFLDREGKTQVYHKSKLVAGVEKTPFVRQLPFLKNWILDLGGAAGNLGRQTEATNFITKDSILVAPVICFESVFGEYLTEYIKNGAQLIVVITNDGWWKNSRGYKQHLLFSQLRAIETRRSIARAANTGTSCFINQRGDLIQPTTWWQQAAIKGKINANNTITVYVKYGNYIARGAAFLSCFLVLMVFVKRFR